MLNQRGQALRQPSDSRATPCDTAVSSAAFVGDRICFRGSADTTGSPGRARMTARPENEADDPHVLVPTESLVVALTKPVKINRDGRAAVGRCQRQRLAAKVNPKDPAFDDQWRLRHGWRLRRRFRREHDQEQTNDGDARYPRPIAHHPHALRRRRHCEDRQRRRACRREIVADELP